jgi:hypothetical protein
MKQDLNEKIQGIMPDWQNPFLPFLAGNGTRSQ